MQEQDLLAQVQVNIHLLHHQAHHTQAIQAVRHTQAAVRSQLQDMNQETAIAVSLM